MIINKGSITSFDTHSTISVGHNIKVQPSGGGRWYSKDITFSVKSWPITGEQRAVLSSVRPPDPSGDESRHYAATIYQPGYIDGRPANFASWAQRPALYKLDNYDKYQSSNNIQRIGVRSQR